MNLEMRAFEGGSCRHLLAVIDRRTWRVVDFPALFLALRHPREGWILVDTGYGDRFVAATQSFPQRFYRWVTPAKSAGPTAAQLAAAGISPAEIRHVIVTHFHADHVGGLAEFPHATIHHHAEALAPLQRLPGWRQVRAAFLASLVPDWLPARARPVASAAFGPAVDLPFPAHDLFGDGSLRLVELPGHAPGQVGLAFHTTAGAQLFTSSGVHGVSHLPNPDTYTLAKTYLQNLGGFLSSREAEDRLVALQLIPAAHPEENFTGDAPAEIRRHLRGVLPGTTDADLLITSCGMSAIHAAFSAVNAIQAPRGRTVWLQLGWLYLDTIAILKKYTASSADYVYVRDVFDLEGLARIFRHHGARIAGVVAEVPTNPLVQTPDLPAIAQLCRDAGAKLLVDPSMSSVFSLDVLPHADLLVCSLTKYTASAGDLTAGLVVVNPRASDAAALRPLIAAASEPLYVRDATRLAWQISRTTSVLQQIEANTPKVVAFLEQHPAIKEVFWALHPASRANYLQLARAPSAAGGMITFTLKKPGALESFYDRLRLPKGPSFGMTTTLICPFMYLAHYDLVTTPAGLAELAASKLDPDLLRLCVGTEPAADIIAALAEALV